ncbi:DNA polymerase epsilon catalytic subunit POL2 [Aspergillus homomorphus CBS 101889]|uniref:DNA polymerase epsilon catalytic subunit n=1 Tax=Aspergillus homomorphus (strain CBS 101889) TaxID=1450537 RepID=A0A395HVJ0_ASPHC|nr:DNA polymerase epsilon catalytic subunit A [Aspergillus homomorphus CBS 101889]RAL10858.1 DNA polymerase epsilon catalytic subunit A [Aspergillus homomorphus CBS 101889]
MPSRKPSKFGNKFRSGGASFNPRRTKTVEFASLRSTEATSQDEKFEAIRLANSIDESLGFPRFEAGEKRVGWLINMHSTSIQDPNVPGGRAGVDYYFLEDGGTSFKATVEYDPYFLIAVKRGHETEVEEWCRRMFEGLIKKVTRVEKEDLSLPNHLLGHRRNYLQLNFANVSHLLEVRRTILPLAEKNRKNATAMDAYVEMSSENAGFDLFDDELINESRSNVNMNASDFIVDIREYDVPYHVRVSIDKDIRIGKWYTVESRHGVISLSCIEERLTRADPLPLKFPDSVIDQIMMISYMIDGQGFLITNREIVSEDINDFEYTPKAEYNGPFMIFNEPDERSVIERFFEHIKEAKPTVIATYNGDFFDWPFVEARASVLGIDMYKEIGFRKNSEDIYQADHCVHMDCFAWVNRDSYLPQGSRGLKAVTVAKLGYDPDELDPELMTPYASERPQTLAEYSVSDAVATYYLYMKYVHPFIFSLCTILPLNPDDTLRKGTGTLCEMLLMVQAYQGNIVLPNKHKDPPEAFYEGHLLESETYVGGHVESIEAGVFRSDIPVTFKVDPTAVDELLRDLDAALKFSIEVEEKKSMDDITNYDEVKKQISEKLIGLKEKPHRDEVPFIYHLDVASMYPNIMITNRLQPDSMIEESNCAACDFNRPGKTCDRRMPWAWRGEFLPAKRDEYNMIRQAVSNEKFPGRYKNSPMRMFGDLSIEEQAGIVKKRLQDYSKKIYHKIHDSKTIVREAIICQRENPFYVDTVRSFRDRRYDFKGKQKVWKGKTEALKSSGASSAEIDEAKKMIILYDSLQLAHKVILNSFYGYVMRKGSRWYSMEMAGVTCLTGARIIQMARELVERIGRPLELDTDGIWCMLPGSFPENFTFTLKNGKKLGISYPCVMLNHLVHGSYTNHQYQTLVDPASFRYETHSDNSIFFEVDGPYKAMILPTSKEEDKNLKKRYAVFNHDGSLAELKGFEVKRRGELKLIKIFQTQIFRFFLEGATLTETYAAVAKVADRWLDVLYEHGATLADEELIDLISENRSMTKTLEEYGNQKSTSITTARRLAEFLGEQMVKDKGLNCKYIISSRPRNTPVTERAIPVAIFSAEESVKRFFLRKWLKDDPGDMDPRTVIDWDYYLERLGSVVQKLITIPAALQKIRNPVPRVAHPDWLQRRINQKDDKFKQTKMTDMFTKSEKTPLTDISANILDHRVQHAGDLDEVIASSTQKLKSSPESKVSQKRKHPEGLPKTSLDPFATLPAKMPSITDDYVGFLNYQKQKWKIQKQARIRRRQLFGERVNVATDSLSNHFRNQAELLYIKTWQVLQLSETSRPGIVRAFVLIDRKVHALTVKVPRQIYVNLKQDSLPDVDVPDCEVEKVNHTLPNGHPSVHLFKLTLSEETYLREANKIDMLLQHPSVEGVYERSIPPNIRAVLKIGSICTFDEQQRGVLGEGLDKGFDLSTLCRTDTEQPYLLDAPMAYHYLYHVASGDRQIFAIFSTTKNEAHIVILNRTRDVQGLPNVDKIYAELLARRLQNLAADNTQSAFEYQEKLHFKTTQVTTRRKAHLEVGDLIKKLKSEETQPAIMVIQSHQRSRLCHDVPILREYPILPVKPEVSDMELPPLGWQSFVARRLVTHYLYLSAWVQHMTLLARYGDVPLCNLENDDPRFLIDISYARRLQQNNVVLWWSSNPRPDHAGYEKDDITGPLEKVPMPSVNMPNAYTTVCIELEVRNLAINTILTSSIINEMEGADTLLASSGTSADANGGVLYSEKAFTSAGAIVLREMVKNWWTQACDGNNMADIMVQHLIRWVESPASCLYDQSLHHYVRMLSRKSFQRLMAEFRRVGSNVIFASSTRLLLHTTKTEVGNAYAFSQYVLKSIRANPSFHFIDLEIKEYWDYLLWYDEYNYGGKGCQEVVESDEQPLETVMHWQLSRFLPTPMQAIFHDWVVEYIELMHGLKRPDNNSSTPRMTQIPIGRPSDEESEEISAILSEKFSKPLKKQITGLIRRQRDELLHPELASDYAFPVLPGVLSDPNEEKRNPVLELVKLLMQVLSLSKTTTMETRLLRRELLALFEIREFSKEGRFENPGASLKLPELTCNACCLIRDLDLCRDEDVLPDPGTESNKTSTKAWRCPFCQTEYDRLAQEEILIGQVHGFIVGWQTQDLKCSKCGGLKVSDFMEHCSCSGAWVETMNRGEIEKKLRLLDSVARFHNLKLLETVVGEVLEQI